MSNSRKLKDDEKSSTAVMMRRFTSVSRVNATPISADQKKSSNQLLEDLKIQIPLKSTPAEPAPLEPGQEPPKFLSKKPLPDELFAKPLAEERKHLERERKRPELLSKFINKQKQQSSSEEKPKISPKPHKS